MLARRVADALPLSYVGKMGINTYAIVTTLLTLLDLVGLLSLRFVGYYNHQAAADNGGQPPGDLLLWLPWSMDSARVSPYRPAAN